MEQRPNCPEGYEKNNVVLKLVANDSIEWTIHHGNLVVHEFAYHPEMNHVVIFHNDEPGDDHGDMEYLAMHDSTILDTLKDLGFMAHQVAVPDLRQTEKIQSINNQSASFYWDLTDISGQMSIVDETEADEQTKIGLPADDEYSATSDYGNSVYYDEDDKPAVKIEFKDQTIVLTHENTVVYLYKDKRYREVQHVKVDVIINDETRTLFLLHRKLRKALVKDYFFPRNISDRPTSRDLERYAHLNADVIVDDFIDHLGKQARQ